MIPRTVRGAPKGCGLLRHVYHAQQSLTVLTGLHQEAEAAQRLVIADGVLI